MRHEVLYLTDIVDAADQIAEFLAETESAVLHNLSIIGEAAALAARAFMDFWNAVRRQGDEGDVLWQSRRGAEYHPSKQPHVTIIPPKFSRLACRHVA